MRTNSKQNHKSSEWQQRLAASDPSRAAVLKAEARKAAAQNARWNKPAFEPADEDAA